MFIKILRDIVNKMGYDLVKRGGDYLEDDISADTEFMDLFDQCKAYTMTSRARMYCLFKAVNYIIDNNIGGDFVECGVWRGGSSMMIALSLKNRKQDIRKIYLYDTFEGMSEPTDNDKTFLGDSAAELLKVKNITDVESIWCYSSLEEVKQNLFLTGYPQEQLIFVKGKVEDTLSLTIPQQIALLRLDTDWYESTKKELEILYPLLNTKGILIIDDFGHWEGAKKAVLEYFNNSSPFFHRIDYTGRIMIK